MTATFTVIGGVTGLLGFLATVPFTPALYWSWRLRKHTDTVKALDPQRHVNQHEILMRRADYLASRVAAAHHFPADRTRLRYVALVVGSLVGYVASAVYMTAIGRKPWEGLGFFDILELAVVSMMLLTWADMTWKSYKHTRWHRERFIRKGCPPTYSVPPTLRDAIRESHAAEADPYHVLWRRQERAARLRRNGTLPPAWKPVSWIAKQRRRLSGLVRSRPLYLGGCSTKRARAPAVPHVSTSVSFMENGSEELAEQKPGARRHMDALLDQCEAVAGFPHIERREPNKDHGEQTDEPKP